MRSTYITPDTEALAAHANEKSISAAVAYAKDATRYDKSATDADTARKLKVLRLSLDLPLVIECVDTEEKIEAILPELDGMIGGGLITLEKARVIMYRPEVRPG